MLNILGWISFFMTSVIAFASVIVDIKTFGYKPKSKKFIFNIFSFLAIFLGMAIYPFEKREEQRENAKLKKDLLNLKNKNQLLDIQIVKIDQANEKLTKQNDILNKQIYLNKMNLKKYKSQISQLSVMFSAYFEIDSDTDISNGKLSQFYMIPHVALSSMDNYQWIYFQSSPPNHRLDQPFPDQFNNNPKKYYSYSGLAYVANANFPIGQNINRLKEMKRISIYVPMHTKITSNRYGIKTFSVSGCSLFFTLNGVDLGKHRINCPAKVRSYIGEFPDDKHKDEFLLIQFELEKSVYEILNLQQF